MNNSANDKRVLGHEDQNGELVLSVSDLECRFTAKSNKILENIEFELRKGDFLGIFGPNGAAKTTLLRCLLGFLPVSGHIRWGGRELQTMSRLELAQLVSFVPQSSNVPFEMTAAEIIEMGGYAKGKNSLTGLKEAFVELEIEHLLGRVFNKLSGGEKQRILIARALFQSEKVIVLDEPVSAQDLHHALKILKYLRKLADQGSVVICVSHKIPLCAAFASKALVLQCGRNRAYGTPREVFTEELFESVFRLQARLIWDSEHWPKLEIQKQEGADNE